MKFLEKNREIDYRKVLSICLALLLLMVAYEAVQYKKESNFNKLHISIEKNNADRTLMNNETILKLMREHLGFDPSVANIDEIDFRGLEEALEANPYIQEASIYLNARHELIVDIIQRKPIARVKTSEVDYYVATDGKRIPMSNYATLRVPVVTGYVHYINGKTKESRKKYDDMLNLLKICHEDNFFEALVEQIDIDRDGKLTIIPKIGNEKIVFGDLTETKNKLKKLKKYYEWGRSQDGWDRYAYLNLEITNQIALGK